MARDVRRRRVPEVLAEQDGGAAEAAIEGAHAVAAREVAQLVEEPVGRQVDLAVHVHQLAAVEEHRGVVERDTPASPRSPPATNATVSRLSAFRRFSAGASGASATVDTMSFRK